MAAGGLQEIVHASCTCASFPVRQMTLNNHLHVWKANYLIAFVYYVKEGDRLLVQTCASCQNNEYPEVLICCYNHLIFKTEVRACTAHMIRRAWQSWRVLFLIPPSSGPDRVRTDKPLTKSHHQHFPLVCTAVMMNTALRSELVPLASWALKLCQTLP